MRLESRELATEFSPNLALGAGCLIGPLAWFVQLEATYAIAAESCGSPVRPWLHLTSSLCLLATAGSALLAWREWGRAGRAWPSVADEGITARVRFLGVLGLLLSLTSAVVILAQWIAVALLDPCPL